MRVPLGVAFALLAAPGRPRWGQAPREVPAGTLRATRETLEERGWHAVGRWLNAAASTVGLLAEGDPGRYPAPKGRGCDS
jgi:hypothetical protein